MGGEIDYHYRIVLAKELRRRRTRNSRYSLRALARDLELDPALLSRVLNKRKALPYASGKRVASALRLSPSERRVFLASLLAEEEKRALARVPESPWQAMVRPDHQFAWDRFVGKDIGWHYMAIFYLTSLESFRPDAHWIASTLGISVARAGRALSQLKALGLLEERDGQLRRTSRTLSPPESVRGGAKDRRYQRLMLEKAGQALHSRPSETLARGAMVCLSPDFLPQIEALVQEFVMKLKEYSDRLPAECLYECIVSVFPLQVAKEGAAGDR